MLVFKKGKAVVVSRRQIINMAELEVEVVNKAEVVIKTLLF